jgi:type I restriction-modification system DNA methylase subunit
MNRAEKSNGNSELGFEEKLWAAANKLRSNMDASEYKHVVLGLIFLKYISDAFGEVYEELKNDPISDITIRNKLHNKLVDLDRANLKGNKKLSKRKSFKCET